MAFAKLKNYLIYLILTIRLKFCFCLKFIVKAMIIYLTLYVTNSELKYKLTITVYSFNSKIGYFCTVFPKYLGGFVELPYSVPNVLFPF